MALPDLVDGTGLRAEARDAIAELVAAKAATREMGTAPVPGVLADLVRDELTERAWLEQRRDAQQLEEARRAAEAYFRSAALRWGPAGTTATTAPARDEVA